MHIPVHPLPLCRRARVPANQKAPLSPRHRAPLRRALRCSRCRAPANCPNVFLTPSRPRDAGAQLRKCIQPFCIQPFNAGVLGSMEGSTETLPCPQAHAVWGCARQLLRALQPRCGCCSCGAEGAALCWGVWGGPSSAPLAKQPQPPARTR